MVIEGDKEEKKVYACRRFEEEKEVCDGRITKDKESEEIGENDVSRNDVSGADTADVDASIK